MADLREVRAKLIDEAGKALHRKGMDPAPCGCSGRKHRFDLTLERIEALSDPEAPEKETTPYLSVMCLDCGKAQLYVLPLLIGPDVFKKIAGDYLGRIA